MAATEIEGVVKNIIFTSKDRRYTVLKLNYTNNDDGTVVTINASPPPVGEHIIFTGSWVVHPRFGSQFKADEMKIKVPDNQSAIEKYLGSGAIDGLGPAMAKRLVDKFGNDTLDIIEHKPELLAEVPGFGAKTIEKICASYHEHANLRDLTIWLEEHKLSGAWAAGLLKVYDTAETAIQIISHTPYRLVKDVTGIGFITADDIAQKMGLSKNDTDRIVAGLGYVMDDFVQAGNVCVPRTLLLDKTNKLLDLKHENDTGETLDALIRNKDYAAQDIGDEDEFIYTDYLYRAETETAAKLTLLRDNSTELDATGLKEIVRRWELSSGVTLAGKQWEALYGAAGHGVMVLTGGPGTGKTTVVRAILAMFDAYGVSTLLCAPTGRAAKRLQETGGRKAATVHRLLEMQTDDNGKTFFGRNADNPLETDAVIVDEFSMMDIILTKKFLAALPPNCRLIIVGDTDQLPSVGPGTVLADIIKSCVFPSVRLNDIYRQSGRDDLIWGAHKINAGELPDYHDDLESEFQFWEVDEQNVIAQVIINMCKVSLPDLGYDAMSDVQVLSPMHRSECGVDKLNVTLQAVLNPPDEGKFELKFGTKLFRTGDKVMQTKNDYKKGVYNGDIGFIYHADTEALYVDFGNDCQVAYKHEQNEFNDLELAYALSVHKSQGSEYKVVILPLISAHYMMLQRNLLYTAVTRAKEKVIIIGEKKALETAIENDRMNRRYTLLKDRLTHRIE